MNSRLKDVTILWTVCRFVMPESGPEKNVMNL
jgi:hypothetical protein